MRVPTSCTIMAVVFLFTACGDDKQTTKAQTLSSLVLGIDGRTTTGTLQCAKVTFGAKMSDGKYPATDQQLKVSAADTLKTYSDSACATEQRSFTHVAGEPEVIAYVKATTDGTIELTLTEDPDQSIADATNDMVFVASPTVEFTADVLTVSEKDCLKLTLQTQLASTAYKVGVARKYTLGATGMESGAVTGVFFSDDKCTTETTEAIIETGKSSTDFYVRSLKGMALTIAAKSGESTAASTQVRVALSLIGSWVKSCTFTGQTFDTMTIAFNAASTVNESGRFAYTLDRYTASGCAAAVWYDSIIKTGTFALGDLVTSAGTEARKLDLKFTASQIAPQPSGVNTYNTEGVCGHSDWSANSYKTTFDVTECGTSGIYAAFSNQVNYEVVQTTTATSIQFGNVGLFDRSSDINTTGQAAARPTSLNATPYTKQ